MSGQTRQEAAHRSSSSKKRRHRKNKARVQVVMPEPRPDEQEDSDHVTLLFGEEERPVPVEALEIGSESRAQRQEELLVEAERPQILLNNLLALGDSQRWAVLTFILETQLACALRVGGRVKVYSGCFKAVLALLVGGDDVKRCDCGRRAAIEAAVLFHAGALPLASDKVFERLSELGVTSWSAAAVKKEATSFANGLAQRDAAEEGVIWPIPTGVREVLGDAPVPDEAVIPEKWGIDEKGVYLAGDDEDLLGEPLLTAPLVISAQFASGDGQHHKVLLAWKIIRKWHRLLVSRGKIASAREIVELANRGLPVNSLNAAAVVEYLNAFEAANRDVYPIGELSQHLGWHGSGESQEFLLIDRYIDHAGEVRDTAAVLRDGVIPQQGAVFFDGSGPGDEQLAQAFCQDGDLSTWREAIQRVKPFPRVWLAICASLAAPLLTIFRVANFIVDFCGETSTGKTATLKIAASVWGITAPDHRYNGTPGLLQTWNATQNFLERVMTLLQGLPCFVDDTKTANKPEAIARILYAFSGGQGKGRATLDGIARTRTSQSVLLTTGEAPVTSFSQDGGTHARVLPIWGSPFQETSQRIAHLIAQVLTVLSGNYGHAGLEFVKFLQRNREHWDQWRRRHADMMNRYSERAGDNRVAQRFAPVFAVLDMAACLGVEAGVLPGPYSDPVEPLWDEFVRETKEADVATRALELVIGWAISHRAEFWSVKKSRTADSERVGASGDLRAPNSGWAGRWDCGKIPGEGSEPESHWEWIGFIPQRLRDILSDNGFDADAVIRTWHKRGWLMSNEGEPHRSGFKARIDGIQMRVIAITRKAVAALEANAMAEPRSDEEQRQAGDMNGDEGDGELDQAPPCQVQQLHLALEEA